MIVAHGSSNLGAALAPAATALRNGLLVVFPTETVYGLGACALDARAVEGVFRAKRRPTANPLIVHVHSVASARSLAASWPDLADAFAERFWPGPLTIVLKKSDLVPDIVSAGGPTVAIRMPDSPIALALIELAKVPVAAPSANPSGSVSPTRAQHLHPDISAAAAYVIDGGPCRGGIESTVVDLTVTPPLVLRPGLISRAALTTVCGRLAAPGARVDGPVRSPGSIGRHYAPHARLTLTGADAVDRGSRAAENGVPTVVLTLTDAAHTTGNLSVLQMPGAPASYAERLYDVLLAADASGAQEIVVEMPPEDGAWEAVRDRLSRASLR